MSRTRHVTCWQWSGKDWRTLELGERTSPGMPHRTRPPTRLTRPKIGEYYWPNTDRPKNNGRWPGGVGNAGKRRRRRARLDKLLGRRLDRRRRNRTEFE